MPFHSFRTLLEESLLQKFLCVKTVSDKVVRHSLACGLLIGTNIGDLIWRNSLYFALFHLIR